MAIELGVNSYTSLDETDNYFTDYLGSEIWFDANILYKSASLVSASRDISLYVKDSCKLPFTPPLINSALATATQELALNYINIFCTKQSATSSGSISPTAQLKRAKAGSAEVEFFELSSEDKKAFEEGGPTDSVFPKKVMKLLINAGCLEDSLIAGVIATGTDAESSFCDPKPFGRTDGFY